MKEQQAKTVEKEVEMEVEVSLPQLPCTPNSSPWRTLQSQNHLPHMVLRESCLLVTQPDVIIIMKIYDGKNEIIFVSIRLHNLFDGVPRSLSLSLPHIHYSSFSFSFPSSFQFSTDTFHQFFNYCLTCSLTTGRTSYALTTAPIPRAVPIEAKPATPAPKIRDVVREQ